MSQSFGQHPKCCQIKPESYGAAIGLLGWSIGSYMAQVNMLSLKLLDCHLFAPALTKISKSSAKSRKGSNGLNESQTLITIYVTRMWSKCL